MKSEPVGGGAERETMPEKWVCDTCGTEYAEYVNGCPHCGTIGIRSRVESLPENEVKNGD